jgi:signal transduction histidine kinase/ActR/RegA family two-component response regulator
VVTVETVFTVILISFYLLNGFKGALYTALAILPIVIYIYANGQHFGGPQTASQQLASPGFNIMVILHFITFIMCLYLYNQAVYQNLREKEILNAQLAVNVKEAKALAESRALFLSTMSHELRTPLNGVIGMTNILKATATEEQKENLNILEFSATNLLAMINDILDFNKGSLDKIELEALPVNISDLLNKVCQGLEIRAKQKGLNWGQEIDRLLNENTVVTDPTRLTQIIYNLAGNAIKFTDEGGTVTIKAKVLERTDNNLYVKLSVSDTGIGIAPDRQEEIFDPFVQASPDTTRKYGGTGLGLAIVKTLTARFGGKIELESEPGKGSVFSFSLKFPVHSGKLITNSPKQIKNESLKGLKLLIVDDNEINILVLEKLLYRWDIKTATALNGKEALLKLAGDDFDGVLMDVHMPEMDGYETTLAIRASASPAKANIAVIAVTGSVSEDVFFKIKEVGMQDYISKPLDAEKLYEKISKIHQRQKLTV